MSEVGKTVVTEMGGLEQDHVHRIVDTLDTKCQLHSKGLWSLSKKPACRCEQQ
jgi:hypothetical protein